jgi:hypothetical protein
MDLPNIAKWREEVERYREKSASGYKLTPYQRECIERFEALGDTQWKVVELKRVLKRVLDDIEASIGAGLLPKYLMLDIVYVDAIKALKDKS